MNLRITVPFSVSMALEVVDLGVALLGLLGRDPAVDRRHQHVLVVAAVEDHHLAVGRHALVDAPQVVVRLLVGWSAPSSRTACTPSALI